MNVLVSYSRPRGKYGRYIFTVMIYFAHPTESARIEVSRPQTETQTKTVYRCDHCGRWATITTHQTVTVNTPLRPAAHQKDGRIELYRYDNAEPDDFMELVLRDSDLLKYQMTKVNISWDAVKMESYWRFAKFDNIREKVEADYIKDDRDTYRSITGKSPLGTYSFGVSTTSDFDRWHEEQQQKKQSIAKEKASIAKEEKRMMEEFIYTVNLLNWDECVDTRPEEMGDLRIEEELIRKTMNAEQITITDLLLEPKGQPLEIEGQKRFIEAELRYID
jgi:hypothetical protein